MSASREIAIMLEIERLGVKLVSHTASRKMWFFDKCAKLLGIKDFRARWWMTLGKTIYYPLNVKEPFKCLDVLEHELVHVRQQQKCGLILWGLRYIASPTFRYKQEREAYLVNVKRYMEIDDAVACLMKYSLWGISENEIRAWFYDQLDIII